jgi:hypothetical protein
MLRTRPKVAKSIPHVDLGGTKHSKVIIFVVKKCVAHDLANQLWEDEFTVDSLHRIGRGGNKQK